MWGTDIARSAPSLVTQMNGMAETSLEAPPEDPDCVQLPAELASPVPGDDGDPGRSWRLTACARGAGSGGPEWRPGLDSRPGPRGLCRADRVRSESGPGDPETAPGQRRGTSAEREA